MRNERGCSGWLAASVGAGLAGLGGILVARAIIRDWDEVAPAVMAADWRWFVFAFLLGGLGMVGIGLAWRRALAMAGIPVSWRTALAWYFLGQLGKYVPGGIWPVVGRGELATRGGASRSRSYGAVLLSMGATYLAGMLLVAALLPFELTVVGATGGVAWLLLLGPVGVLFLRPAVLDRFLDAARRATGRRIEIDAPAWGASMRLVALHLPSWLAVGMATWCVAIALQGSTPIMNVVVAAILAWVAGFLVLPAPGGLGVREAVFILAATSLSAGMAGAVAVVARILFMIVDAAGAGLSLIFASTEGSRDIPLSERSTSSPGEAPSALPEDS